MKSFTPAQKYTPCHDTITHLSYPLTLHSRATIRIYWDRGSTPLKALCRQCKTPTTISLTQQKLFLTAERLFLKITDRVADIERNQTNTWAVNYEVGIYEPFVDRGRRIHENKLYPFVNEFELKVVVKLLQKVGGRLDEKSLNLYLKILRGMDEIIEAILPPAVPPVSHILDRKSPLRSFKDLKELFEVFDKVERGSYAAARLMEAYADAIVDEACIDCWAKHNIVDDNGVDDASFVDPFPFPPTIQEQPIGQIHTINPHIGFPVTMQHRHRPPGPRQGMGVGSRQPFGELGNNIRSGLKRSGEEEDQLERRWRERTRKRKAARVSQLVRDGANIVGPARKFKWGERESQESEVVVID